MTIIIIVSHETAVCYIENCLFIIITGIKTSKLLSLTLWESDKPVTRVVMVQSTLEDWYSKAAARQVQSSDEPGCAEETTLLLTPLFSQLLL